jgi:hypothetical protein
MQLYRLLYSVCQISDAYAILLGIAIFLWNDKNLTYLGVVIWVTFGVDWTFLLFFGVWRRRMSTLLFPLLLVATPIFDFACRYYTIATLRRRTWGGPRVRAKTE